MPENAVNTKSAKLAPSDAPDHSPYVVLDDATVAFSNDVVAIKNLSLAIHETERVAIIGRSGCGKTTCLKVMAGIQPLSSGAATIGQMSPSDHRRHKGVGFCFQRPMLFEWRTALQNVILPVEIRDGDVDNARRQGNHFLSMVGLTGFEHARPSELSGGMQQRVSLVRAHMIDSPLLLMDEAWSALDEFTREAIWLDMLHIWKQHRATVCMVTHNIREAVFLGDRVLVMSPRPGRIVHEFDINLPRGSGNRTVDDKRVP